MSKSKSLLVQERNDYINDIIYGALGRKKAESELSAEEYAIAQRDLFAFAQRQAPALATLLQSDPTPEDVTPEILERQIQAAQAVLRGDLVAHMREAAAQREHSAPARHTSSPRVPSPPISETGRGLDAPETPGDFISRVLLTLDHSRRDHD